MTYECNPRIRSRLWASRYVNECLNCPLSINCNAPPVKVVVGKRWRQDYTTILRTHLFVWYFLTRLSWENHPNYETRHQRETILPPIF